MTSHQHPLDIPEILRMIGPFLDHLSQRKATQVSTNFRANLTSVVWKSIVVCLSKKALYTGTLEGGNNILSSWDNLQLYCTLVRDVTITSDYPGERPSKVLPSE